VYAPALMSSCPPGPTRHGTARPDGCVECGTCRVIAEVTGDIEWNYPRGGYGVSFKFG
jgi:ferredoxin-like protein FixX